MEDLFIAQGQRPAGLEPIDLAALRPMQRVFLVADGTVTQLVEALTLEPVEISVLAQGIDRLAVDDDWLVAEAGAEVCRREVVLRGARSGTPFLYAASTIAMDRVPADVAHGLERERESIGRILQQSGLECRRERLWYGAEQPAALPEPVRGWAADGVLSRAYRIVAGGRPLMVIDEKIPRGWPD